MALCSFSSESVISNQTTIDNIFFTNYLPYAPDACVKVYLYGLYKCNTSTSYDNNIEDFTKALNMSEDDIHNAFLYWQEQGLVQVLNTLPFEIRYLPLKNIISNKKKYKESKYAPFVSQVEEIIKGRMILPNEFHEYFELIEYYHFEPEALIMLIQYCLMLKGDNVGYPYILTVAKNWASQKILTCNAVEEKLQELEKCNSEANEILKIFASKRKPTIEEMQLLDKWLNDLEYDLGTVKYVAKLIKKLKQPTFEKLDSKLMSFYEMKLYSIKDIEEYEENKTKLFDIAKTVCKQIGVYYENLEPVVENYICKWLQMGFDEVTLQTVASYCFKCSIRTLEGVDATLGKFFKLGITTSESIDKYLNDILALDELIKEILTSMGLTRSVNQFDRDYYKVWTQDWNMSSELILYGASCACGKIQPMQYLNKLLSSWHQANVNCIEQAKKITVKDTYNKAPAQEFVKRDYEKSDLNKLFNTLEEIDL